MSWHQHLELISRGPVSRVRLSNERPRSAEMAAEFTREWNSIAKRTDCQALFMDCSCVRVLNSDTLSMLIVLQRRLKRNKARLVLCELRPEVREVLSWTKVDRFFEIEEDQGRKPAALA